MAQESALVNLPDELILHVMGYLTTSDLLELARTCRRMRGLEGDRTLWVDVDLRRSKLGARQLCRLLRYLHGETRRICLAGHETRGRPLRQQMLTPRCLTDIKQRCESLVELKLERCLLNARELPLELLPRGLLSLSLRESEVTNRPAGRSYFHRLWELVPRLTEFDLTGCGWVDSHALLPLSKLTHLRSLTLRACRRLGGEIAYSSIACTLGFRELQELDVRRTQVADSDVSGFCQLPQLQSLLLEPSRPGLLDGDATLRVLGQYRAGQIKRLALRGCPLTDSAAGRLPQLLPGLRRLDLTRATVTPMRRSWLAAQLPACVVSCHEPESARRRPRSESPSDLAGDAQTGKRPRHCECVGCAVGSDAEEDVDVQEEGQEEREERVEREEREGVEALQRRLGRRVIVVNLFARQPPAARRSRRRDRVAEVPVRRLLAVVNDPPLDPEFIRGVAEQGRQRVDGIVLAGRAGEEAAVVEPAREEVAAVVGPAGQQAAAEGPAEEEEAAVFGPAGQEEAAVVGPVGEEEIAVVEPTGEEEAAVVGPARDVEAAVVRPAGEEDGAVVGPAVLVGPVREEEAAVIGLAGEENAAVVGPVGDEAAVVGPAGEEGLQW